MRASVLRSLALALAGGALLAMAACKANEAPPAPAPAPMMQAVQPPAPIPPPAPPPPPPPPASPLRAALLGAHDLESFRAVMADRLALSKLDAKDRPSPAGSLTRAKLDGAAFEHKVKPLLPHEPDPSDGDGEDFTCDDAAHSCVFSDSRGRHTTYQFAATAPPTLATITFPPPARPSKATTH